MKNTKDQIIFTVKVYINEHSKFTDNIWKHYVYEYKNKYKHWGFSNLYDVFLIDNYINMIKSDRLNIQNLDEIFVKSSLDEFKEFNRQKKENEIEEEKRKKMKENMNALSKQRQKEATRRNSYWGYR